ncbi:MAG: GTPase domain-containing protein [Nitrospirae bacterium]|nr:GTPase domain-containing protein [Nitrospirota bacterium]
MALFNYATKEITLKIVYYGPGLSGKTTNLQYLHSILDPKRRGKLLSLSTEADRTLFFDFLPVELGKVQDFSIRFQLYTVPGQVRYNATRRLVLKGADAVVFVADSQRDKLQENIESLENMRENLIANNINPDDIPLVIQYNKRDLDNAMSLTELNAHLNKMGVPFFESVATEGRGVKETFEAIVKLLLKHISKKHKIDIETRDSQEVATMTEQPQEEKVEPFPKAAAEEVPEKQPLTEQPAVSTAAFSQDGLREVVESINQLRDSIDRLNSLMEKEALKTEEILGILDSIKKSIDNAKTKKRWFLFG